ncbi:MAG: FAD-dependent oxidoreductase, partial [Acidobacteriaceae bacterium]|nr:FAD-dependent oxidoreductase [Acidobacteriaceae bacterium]
GLAAAVALGSEGRRVTLFEARPFLGGRATSYPLNTADENSPTIDNCQHVLLRCCTNLADFYTRLGVENRIRFYREFYWIEPGGRVSILRRGMLPAPFHFTGSFAKLRFLGLDDKAAIARALLSVRYEYGKRADLEHITFIDWLREKKQTQRAIDRFWQQVIVSASVKIPSALPPFTLCRYFSLVSSPERTPMNSVFPPSRSLSSTRKRSGLDIPM